jgi:hypothetical protein
MDLQPAPADPGDVPRAFCSEAALERAFQLAHRIHPDRRVALQLAALALTKLDAALLVQDKRLYYRPRGRGEDPLPFRTRVSFGEWPLLQRLVYIESEPFERESEATGLVGEDDLLLRFVKHLVRITTRRNSFYVTLGLSRLLYGYDTAEAMHIHQVVVQDPDRTKDDYYFRSRKAVLMREIEARFGGLVARRRSARGEQRFEAAPATPRQAELVHECLRLFTPWETACPVPVGFDPMMHVLPGLSSRRPEHEHEIEINRMHAVIDPDCCERIAGALRLAPPRSRLEVPSFASSSAGRGSGRGGGERTPLSADERGWLKHVLDDETDRRHRVGRPQVLRVIVDGSERARLELQPETRATLPLPSAPEIVELRADGRRLKDVLLGVALVPGLPGADGFAWSVPVAGHPDLLLTLSPDANEGAVLTVGLDAPARVRSLAERLQEWLHRRFAPLRGPRSGRDAWWPTFASAVSLVAVGIVVASLWRPPSVSLPSPNASAPSVASSVAPTAAPAVPTPDRPTRTVPSRGEALRSGPQSSVRSLREIRRLWIDAPSEEMRDALRSALGGALELTPDRDQADAALKVATAPGGYRVRLVNAAGKVLWPAGRARGAVYSGSVEAVAGRVAADLRRALETPVR